MFYDPIADEFFAERELGDRVAEYQSDYFDALDRGDDAVADVYAAALESLEAESGAVYEEPEYEEPEFDEEIESEEISYGELDDYMDEADDLADYFDWDRDDLDDPFEYDISFEYEEAT